jgi:hypothetical protein
VTYLEEIPDLFLSIFFLSRQSYLEKNRELHYLRSGIDSDIRRRKHSLRKETPMNLTLDRIRKIIMIPRILILSALCSTFLSLLLLWQSAERIQTAEPENMFLALIGFGLALFFLQSPIAAYRIRTRPGQQHDTVSLIASVLSIPITIVYLLQ